MKKLQNLTLFLLVSSLVLHPVVLYSQACQGLAGQWTDNMGYVYTLTQSGTNIGGSVTLPGGCAQNWTVTGTLNQNGTYTLHSTGTGCPAVDSWDDTGNALVQPGCREGTGSWVNSDQGSGTYSWSKACDVPPTESNVFNNWDDAGFGPSVGVFRATLSTGGGLMWGGRTISEIPAQTGYDECKVKDPNSPYPDYGPGQGMDGSSIVDWNQQYDDATGWLPQHVSYYRTSGAAPCTLTRYQQMRMACSSSSVTNYKVNVHSATINATTVQSCRDGICATRLY